MKNKKKSEDEKEISREKQSFDLLYKLTNVFIRLELLFNTVLLLLYITGNYQQFQNKTQLLILNMILVNSVTMAILSVFCLLEIIIIAVVEKKFKNKIGQTFISIFGIIFGIVLILVSSVIIKISIGIN